MWEDAGITGTEEMSTYDMMHGASNCVGQGAKLSGPFTIQSEYFDKHLANRNAETQRQLILMIHMMLLVPDKERSIETLQEAK